MIFLTILVVCFVLVGLLWLLARWTRWLVVSKKTSTIPKQNPEQAAGLELDETTGIVLHPTQNHTAAHGHYLATACDLAYLPADEAQERFRQDLNLHASLISVDNTQAYIAQNATSIVVAFRGSEFPGSIDGFKDWLLTNARNFLVLPEGRIGTDFAAAGVGARFHRGFMEAVAEIWQPLHSAVDEAMRTQTRPLWITGHSLGGAVALMAAWRLQQTFIPVHQICTFGAPMVGNRQASDAYKREFPGRIVRYVDYNDMVPKLPTMSLLSNEYDHVQREIILGNDTNESMTQPLAADETDDDEITDPVANRLWLDVQSGIASHLMSNYILQIQDQMA